MQNQENILRLNFTISLPQASADNIGKYVLIVVPEYNIPLWMQDVEFAVKSIASYSDLKCLHGVPLIQFLSHVVS